MLWDIYRKTQNCGLGQDDSIILDGAHGATSRRDIFIPVLTVGQRSRRHVVSQLAIRTMPVTVFIGIVWTGVSSATYAVNGLSIAGIILLCTASIFVLLFQVHDSQPLFFGLEGYVDIYNLELLLFGTYERRLH